MKNTKKKSLNRDAHIYGLGSSIKKFNNIDGIGDITSTIGAVASPLITQGNKHPLGEATSLLGDVVGQFNPFWGLAIKGAGTFVNAGFGSNINQPQVTAYNNQIGDLARTSFNAKSNTDLLNQYGQMPSININRSAMGTQGWFNHNLDNVYNSATDNLRAAQMNYNNKYSNAVSNVDKYNDALIAANYNAYGGPLFGYLGDGAVAYDVAKDNLIIKQMEAQNKATKTLNNNALAYGGMKFPAFDNGINIVGAGGTHGQNPFGGVPMGIAPDGMPNLVEEGEVIFKDYVYSKRLKVPKSLRDKYRFLRGGKLSFAEAMEQYFKKNGVDERENDPIIKNGLDAFAMDLALSQEQLKMKKQARQMGIMAEGGHLFEDGSHIGTVDDRYKTAWGTYVMPGVEQFLQNYIDKYNRAIELGDTETAEILKDEVIKQFNDIQSSYQGISKSALGNKSAAIGAHQKLFNDAGGNYGFAGRENIPGIDALIDQSAYRGITGDNAGGNFTPDDIYGWRTNIRHFGSNAPEDAAYNQRLSELAAQMGLGLDPTLEYGNDGYKLYTLSKLAQNAPAAVSDVNGIQGLAQSMFPIGNVDMGRYNATVPDEEVEEPELDKLMARSRRKEAWGEMLPKVANGISKNAGLLANLYGLAYNLNDPYRPAVLNEVGPFQPITANPIGDYVPTMHIDTNYEANQLAQQAAATRDAIMQSNLPSRNQAMLAADFNAQVARGNLLRDAALADYDLGLKKGEFNRGTNQYNSQLGFNVGHANMQGRQYNQAARMQQGQFNTQMYDQFKRGRDQAIGAGITGLANWFDAARRDSDARNMLAAVAESGALELNDPMRKLLGSLMMGGGKLNKKRRK